MQMAVTRIEDWSGTRAAELASQIEEKYVTGGPCEMIGVSPVDSAFVMLFPDFTAVATGEVDEYGLVVDEWGCMLDQVHDGFLEVKATLL